MSVATFSSPSSQIKRMCKLSYICDHAITLHSTRNHKPSPNQIKATLIPLQPRLLPEILPDDPKSRLTMSSQHPSNPRKSAEVIDESRC